jgi:hypothetical protein
MCPISFAGAGVVLTASALLATQIPGVDDAISAGTQIGNMSVSEILALALVACVLALVWAAWKVTGKWESLMVAAINACNNASAAANKIETSATDLKQAALVLAEISAHCRLEQEAMMGALAGKQQAGRGAR